MMAAMLAAWSRFKTLCLGNVGEELRRTGHPGMPGLIEQKGGFVSCCSNYFLDEVIFDQSIHTCISAWKTRGACLVSFFEFFFLGKFKIHKVLNLDLDETVLNTDFYLKVFRVR